MSMSDDFSSRFDSIPVEKAQPLAEAPPETHLAFGEMRSEFPDETGPGFTLLDDGGGRFAIERDTGIITLLHDETLATDAGAVFPVRLRCVEYSGLAYDQDLHLRITGRVPQIVGGEANDALSRLAQGPLDAEPVAPVRRVCMTLAGPAIAPATEVAVSDWSEFAAFRAHAARRPLDEPGAFGGLIGALPPVNVDADLALAAAPPAPAPAHLSWAI